MSVPPFCKFPIEKDICIYPENKPMVKNVRKNSPLIKNSPLSGEKSKPISKKHLSLVKNPVLARIQSSQPSSILENQTFAPNPTSPKKKVRNKTPFALPSPFTSSQDYSAMTQKDEKSSSESPNNTGFKMPDPFSFGLNKGGTPNMMDFYKGWMNFYQHQWELFFKTWAQFLGQPGLSQNIFMEQTKEFQNYYASWANQFQECASIAQRTTQETMKMMQGSTSLKKGDHIIIKDKNNKP